MNGREIADFLRSWQPTGEWRDPSRGGLGCVLTDLAKEEAERLSREAQDFQGLDPVYLGSLYRGFRDAVKSGVGLDWEPVVALARWIAEQEEVPPCKVEEPDEDRDWSWPRKAVLGLVEAGLEEGRTEIPIGLRSVVWEILESLSHDPDPTEAKERGYIGTGSDLINLAINTVRAEAINAVVRYALWVRRHIDKEADTSERPSRGIQEISEVRGVLEEHLDPDVDPSLAVRSLYGQWFPWFVLLDAKWAEGLQDKIFPPETDQASFWDAAWKTYVTFCQAYGNVFRILREQYGRALERIGAWGPDQAMLMDPDARLAGHLMDLYAWEHLQFEDSDKLLERFYEKAPSSLRGRAFMWIGRALGEPDGPMKPVIMERLQALWERRLRAASSAEEQAEFPEEMAAFGFWFVSGKFETDWAIRQLHKALDIALRAEPDFQVVERLAAVAEEKPLESVECLRIMTDGDREGWSIRHWNQHIRSILQTAIKSGVEEARERAVDMVHHLGERGHFDFRDLLPETE